jgi:hypothetical protein
MIMIKSIPTETPGSAPSTSGKQRTYVVVLRARSSARFLPEEGFSVSFNDVPGCAEPVRFGLRTRWVDEGYAAPLPRELWIEARGPAPSLDHAVAVFGSSGRSFANLLAFTANTPTETPEVHLAYDATRGVTEREFVEVFVADERGHPREGRIARTSEMVAVFSGLQNWVAQAPRLNRALQQYALALRYWYFGGEWLALAHLYMAAETLTKAVLAHACADNETEALAMWLGIDTADAGKWRHELQVWARRDVIFEGDNETYRDARHASDGIEHGFLEFDEINRHAVAVTSRTFGYIRRCILRLLAVSETDYFELYVRVPRDVSSLRKLIRGHFVGDGGDPAPPNEEYPRLEWNSGVRTVEREGDRFRFSFQERFTVRCAAGYGFRGIALEARGRLEPGDEPARFADVAQISGQAAAKPVPGELLLALLRRANLLASRAATPSATTGIPTLMANVFSIFAEQVALLEAIEALVKDNRPVEAMVLLRSLMRATCQLELVADHPDPAGAALRLKLDALERQAKLYESEPSIADRVREYVVQHRAAAAERSITIPDTLPDIRGTGFFTKNANSLRFVDEVASAGDFAAMLHIVKDDEGHASLHTRTTDVALLTGVVADAVDAVRASAVALTKAFNWPLDTDLAAEIAEKAERLSEEFAASEGNDEDNAGDRVDGSNE